MDSLELDGGVTHVTQMGRITAIDEALGSVSFCNQRY